jgi:hypothetical protein
MGCFLAALAGAVLGTLVRYRALPFLWADTILSGGKLVPTAQWAAFMFQRDPMRVHADYRPYSVRYYRASHPMTYPTTCIRKRYRSTESPNSAGLKSPMTECLKSSVIQDFITSAIRETLRGTIGLGTKNCPNESPYTL